MLQWNTKTLWGKPADFTLTFHQNFKVYLPRPPNLLMSKKGQKNVSVKMSMRSKSKVTK